MNYKTFPLSTILTVTTGRLLTPPETVELGGKTYLKSELEVALENINPIED